MTTHTREMHGRHGQIVTCAFFSVLFGILFFLGQWGQPLAHPYFDQVGIRDTGTLFSYLASQPEPVKAVIGRAMLHFEGPLQFLLLNAYCYTVGNVLPLNPSTMQFPNTVLALLAAVLAYLLGSKLVSPRMGYCCALAFALGPWLGETVREPWYFNTLSCFLHFLVIYCYVCLIGEPESLRYRVAAPASLAVYLLTGMDWPSFLFSLGLFLATCGRFRRLLMNPFNLLVGGAVAVQLAWPLLLFLAGKYNFLPGTMLLYPFLRYGDLASNPDLWPRIWTEVLRGWGPQVILAAAGLALYVLRLRRELFPDRLRRALFDSMCVWLVGAGYALIRSSTSATYLYVAAVPTSLLAGLILVRMRSFNLVAVAVIMAIVQVYVVLDRHVTSGEAGRRVLAAAAFLIEKRPDLLTRTKTAFLPRNVASDVGQYARGANRRIIMPQEFPVELRKHAIGSDEKTLREFVDAYHTQGRIRADWLILDSELFSKQLAASRFYTRLRDDPAIRWIARFKDRRGELFIGEVERQRGSPVASAPLMHTRRLSDRYEAKYDRIHFLKKNAQYVDNN